VGAPKGHHKAITAWAVMLKLEFMHAPPSGGMNSNTSTSVVTLVTTRVGGL
jgi:hypothetical protein